MVRVMEPLLLSVGGAALTEGVTFLYAQASEFLRTWRARRGGRAEAPVAMTPPGAVTVGTADPLVDPRDTAMEDTLQDLRDLAEQVKDGTIEVTSERGRQIVSELRDYLEILLRAPITLAGEVPRSFHAGSVAVITARVEGDVAGVRVAPGAAGRVGDVSVRTGDVAPDGRVTGVEFG